MVIHPNRHAELLSEVKAVAAQHTPHMAQVRGAGGGLVAAREESSCAQRRPPCGLCVQAQPGVDDTSVSGLPLKHVVTEDKTDLKHVLP